MSNVGSGITYEKDPNETTEWDDILVARGIIAPRKDKIIENEQEDVEESTGSILDKKTSDELDDLEVNCLMLF